MNRTPFSIYISIEGLLIKEVGVLRLELLGAILKCMLVRENGCAVVVSVGIIAMNFVHAIIKDSVVIDFDTLHMIDVVVVYQTSIGNQYFIITYLI